MKKRVKHCGICREPGHDKRTCMARWEAKPIPKWTAYRERNLEKGLCGQCPEPLYTKHRCKKHYERHREQSRRKVEAEKRLAAEKRAVVVEYALEHGLSEAAGKFNVAHSTACRWLRKSEHYPRYAPSRGKHSKQTRENVLNYVRKRGIKKAAEHFKISKYIIYDWFKVAA